MNILVTWEPSRLLIHYHSTALICESALPRHVKMSYYGQQCKQRCLPLPICQDQLPVKCPPMCPQQWTPQYSTKSYSGYDGWFFPWVKAPQSSPKHKIILQNGIIKWLERQSQAMPEDALEQTAMQASASAGVKPRQQKPVAARLGSSSWKSKKVYKTLMIQGSSVHSLHRLLEELGSCLSLNNVLQH
ncbi:proline-rich protein 9-like [Alligator mississippiensis]|uniref:Proline-rich protein 9-like n=1 Tax=Alligator mississippiensis TaxID=8496 RepID=A0A151M7H3_ALLMI|nr:proline-rich protein 9-like [Alligator mississippiensis]